MIINLPGVDIFYEKSGSGDPMILLHGNSEDHHIFDEISKKLSNNFTIYAIDSRNHGQSQRTNIYSYDTMAQDIYNFIKTLRLNRINIIGFSDGAIISLILAIHHQDIINKMALLGVNLKPSDISKQGMELIDGYIDNNSPLYKMLLDQPNIEYDDIKHILIPSLVVGGENDIFVSDVIPNVARALPNSQLKILKNHDHISYIVNTDVFYPDLIEFFK
jgi:pimeloyl-ACP methyl ester carboxylesterase